ncbi:hypothetical protein [Planctobacterium marinum]|uniref:hypothetical protein n=1 Tax=Planctobacterium marinum TaxID=1631968 RepID=UPI001E35F3A6|nr:hypothetical protein [Planctobacterium marinum]MCC2607530.1 hypothetical protein [Planctobacterium marinum]
MSKGMTDGASGRENFSGQLCKIPTTNQKHRLQGCKAAKLNIKTSNINNLALHDEIALILQAIIHTEILRLKKARFQG